MRLRHIIGAEETIANSPYCLKKKIKNDGVPFNYFDNDKPLELELGMGKGQFIINKALANPDINFIGIEKYASVVLKAIEKLKIITKDSNEYLSTKKRINELGLLDNLIFLCEDVENLLNYFSQNTINKIYLNFSDPWPKKRHENRRITHHRFLELYEKLLKNDGTIEFKTDNKDLFDFSLEEIKNSNFKLISYTYDLHNDLMLNEGNIMTEYEEKFSKKGNPIYKYIAKK